MGAEESLTQRNVVTGVAVWNGAGLLFPAMKITWLPAKLRWLGEFSIAVLQGWGRQIHKQSEKHRGRFATIPNKGLWKREKSDPGNYNS